MKIAKLNLLIIAVCLANPVFAENAAVIKLLQQENWQWTDLEKHYLASSEIHIFAINHELSVDQLARLIAKRFAMFEQIQIIKNNYILSGIYQSAFIQAQVYAVSQTKSRAYISLLKQHANLPADDLLQDLLPVDKSIIAITQNPNNRQKITVFNVYMPINEVHKYLQKQLNSAKKFQNLQTHLEPDNFFWISSKHANSRGLQIYASTTASNQTTIAAVTDLKVGP